MAFTIVTVTATYKDEQGNLAAGTVSFLATSIMENAGELRVPTLINCTLVNGALKLIDGVTAVTLPATDDAGTSPAGVTYWVTERIAGTYRTWLLAVPHTSGTLDLSTVAPALPSSPAFGYALDSSVVHQAGAEVITGAKTFGTNPVFNAGAIPESAVASLTTDLAARALDSAVVHNTGAEPVAGVKTFSSAPVVPAASFPESAIANLTTDLAAKATDSLVVHQAGIETISGVKTFSGGATFSAGTVNFTVAPNFNAGAFLSHLVFLPPPNGTNDTTVINTALAALPSTGGRLVALDGIYKIASDLLIQTDQVAFVGLNASERSGATAPQGGTTVLALGSFAGTNMFTVQQAGTPTRPLSHIKLADLTLDGANVAGFGGIGFQSYRGLIDRVEVTQVTGVALTVQRVSTWNTYGTVVRNSYFITNGSHAISVQGSDVVLEGNEIGNNTGTGVLVNGAGCQVRGNHIWGNAVGCQLDNNSVLSEISDNEFETNNGGGIYFINNGASDIQIDGNHFWNNSQTTTNVTDDINVSPGAVVNHVQITNNQFSDNGNGKKSRFGVTLNSNATKTYVGGNQPNTGAFGSSFLNDQGTATIVASPSNSVVGGFWRYQVKWGQGSVDTGESASPETVVTSATGGIYRRNLSPGPRLSDYLKGSGTGNTGWVPIEPIAKAVITYSASMTPDASQGAYQTIAVTNGTAMTINAATNLVAGMELTLDFLNSSGGAMGAVTWDASYIFAGSFINPLNGLHKAVTFRYDGTNLIEVSRSAFDRYSLLNSTVVVAETSPRTANSMMNQAQAMVSGTLYLNALPLLKGEVVSSITFVNNTTTVGLTHAWFALYDANLNLLAWTGDDTSATNWTANTARTYNIAKNNVGGTITSYTALVSGLFYIGAMFTTSTTNPSLGNGTTVVANTIWNNVPKLCGASSAGLTTTPPDPAAAITVGSIRWWGYVS